MAAAYSFRFSTRAFLPEQRLSKWQQTMREVVQRTVSPLQDGPLDVEMTVRVLDRSANGARHGGVSVVSGAVSRGGVARRTREFVADGNDDLVLHLQQVGPRVLDQRGRVATVAAGAAVLSSNGDASQMVLPQPTRFVSIAVPRTALTALAPAAEDMIVRPLPPRGGALALLLRYLDVLDDASILESPALGHAVAAHLCDLCAVAVGASRDGAEYAQHRGVRAARLRALKDDIAAHLADPSLSPGEIAQRQRMTPRYVHKLFELEGITLSRYVLGLRLLQVHRALTDPLRAGTTISGLAYAAGFGDLSTFNREFRRRFGTTPSDVRASSPRRRHTMAHGR